VRNCRFLREVSRFSCAFVAARRDMVSVDAGMVKELRLAFGKGMKIVLCLGSMLNDTWPTEETKSLSRCASVPASHLQWLQAPVSTLPFIAKM